MKPLLILVCGDPSPALAARRGGYERWFADLLGCPWVAVDARTATLPDPAGFSGVLITGSGSGVHEGLPWMGATARWLRSQDRPTLGVCFGHQLLAWAHGGVVRPARPEYGVVAVDRLVEDPILHGLGDRFHAFESHFDAVVEVPANATVLARSSRAVQALAFGPRVRGVQFHPEFGAEVVADALHRHAEALESLEPGLVAASMDGLRELPDARRVLDNFLEHFVEY